MKLLLLLILFFVSCAPTESILKENVDFNFKEEGFLDPDTLQTIGEALYPALSEGIETQRVLCLKQALDVAKERSLRIMLHTNLNLPARKVTVNATATGTAQKDFDRDYPFPFSKRDLLHAEIDFMPLLDKGYIALQDTRTMEKCTVIFRIKGDDLPGEIRKYKLSFMPLVKPKL